MASLSFCPGLFEAVQASSPPTIDFFRNLPSNGHGRWAVYALVVDKPGAIPLLHIGSGTNSNRWVPVHAHMDLFEHSSAQEWVVAARPGR